jgi:hypothetical protein
MRRAGFRIRARSRSRRTGRSRCRLIRPRDAGKPGAAHILQQLLSGKEAGSTAVFAMQAATAEPTPTLDSFAEELLKWSA